MEQFKVLHQLKKAGLILLILLTAYYLLLTTNVVFAGTYPPCVVDGDCVGDETCVNCPEDCGFCPAPPHSSASPSPMPLPSGSASPSPSPGDIYVFCGTWWCPGCPGSCTEEYDVYCWPNCDQTAQICYRVPECYQPCRDCAICGCGEAPVVGEVASCADINMCGVNHCDHETGECHSECYLCGGPGPTPTPTPTPDPFIRPNIISLYHMVGEGTQGEISLGMPVNYRATYEDASVASGPTDSLVINGSFESGGAGWWCSDPADCTIETGDSLYGTHSLCLRRDESGDAYYASDWIDAGFELRNQNVTFSFDVSTPAGDNIIYANALQTYPTGGDWNKSKYLSQESQTSTSTNWRRQVFQLTFPSDVPAGESRFRVVLRPPNQMNIDAYFDGIMVEQGHTAGLYTDIDAVQFNLEKDNGHSNLVGNGSFESDWTSWNQSADGTKQIVSNAVYGSNAVYVSGSGARVIQWVPIANNTTYTASLTAKGTGGGNINSDEWCLGGAGNVGIQAHTYPKETSYTRQSWTFTSGTCAADQNHRLAIYFDTYTSSDKIWVDGVLLESGITEGFFMTITEWPLRVLFRPDEGFRIREPQNNTWSGPASALYDEDNLVWYLEDDLTVSDAKLLGKDEDDNFGTFVRINDDDMTVNWQFQLEDNFPTRAPVQDFWYTNLFVKDEGDQDDNVLNWGLEMLNISGWNYHRIEEVNIMPTGTVSGFVWYDVHANGVKDGDESYLPNIVATVTGYGSDSTDSGGNYSIPNVIAGSRTVTVTPPADWECTMGCSKNVVVPPGGTVTANFGIRPYMGTISGNVYRNDTCECSGTTSSPDQTWVVTCSGDGIDGVLNGDTDNYPALKLSNSNYICVDVNGNMQLPYSNYTVLFTSASAGWNRVISCGTSRSPVALNVSSVFAVPPFYQCQTADPWWQVVGGNIHGGEEVRSSVPSGQYLITGSNALVSYGNSLNLFGGSISNSGWAAQSTYEGPKYNYSWWVTQLKNQEKLIGVPPLNDYGSDGVYTLTGGNLFGNLASNRKIVILAEGDVIIPADINVPLGSFLMLISSGTITVRDWVGGSLDNPGLEGIFIADKINFGSGNNPLFAAGNFIAWSSDDNMIIDRNIGSILNLTTPSVTFISRPDLILNAPDFVKKIDYSWQQIPG